MILYPAIDLKKGKCVGLLQGNMNKQTIFNNDPLMQAKLFVNEGCEWLHVVDLDGALTQSFVNKKIIKDIIKNVAIPVQLGGTKNHSWYYCTKRSSISKRGMQKFSKQNCSWDRCKK